MAGQPRGGGGRAGCKGATGRAGQDDGWAKVGAGELLGRAFCNENEKYSSYKKKYL
jgi:hypothetical protein